MTIAIIEITAGIASVIAPGLLVFILSGVALSLLALHAGLPDTTRKSLAATGTVVARLCYNLAVAGLLLMSRYVCSV